MLPAKAIPDQPTVGQAVTHELPQPRSEKPFMQTESKSPTCRLRSEINAADSHRYVWGLLMI